jgi:hypothetical protein
MEAPVLERSKDVPLDVRDRVREVLGRLQGDESDADALRELPGALADAVQLLRDEERLAAAITLCRALGDYRQKRAGLRELVLAIGAVVNEAPSAEAFHHEPEQPVEAVPAPPVVPPAPLERAAPAGLTPERAARAIEAGLAARSDRSWEVRPGEGKATGWILISAPFERHVGGAMVAGDQRELGRLLNIARGVTRQGTAVPPGVDFYLEFIARAEGKRPKVYGSRADVKAVLAENPARPLQLRS